MRRIVAPLFGLAVAALTPLALADEVVHFTNGAEMTVRAHAIEKDMVKLDLGGNNAISFPVSMVDKIVSAGKNVFLNPVYHPSNQAVPVVRTDLPSPLPQTTIRGGGGNVGYRLGQSKTGTGLRLGEALNEPGPEWHQNDSGRVTTFAKEGTERFSTPKPRHFDVLRPEAPGTRLTIDPPGGPQVRIPQEIQFRPPEASEQAPPAQGDGQAPPPSGDEAPPQDPPESH